MKILQVIAAFYPAQAYGGTVEVAYRLSKELVRRGHEVTVYTSDSLDKYHRQKSRFSEIDGIKVYYFKTLNNRLAWNHRLIFTLGILPRLRRNINSFDVVHLHSHYTFLNIATHYYARKFHIPYVLQAHTSVATYFQKGAQKRIFDKLWGYRIIRDARKLIAVSKEESEHYKQMGVAGERISVIYNGMDIESFKNLPKYGRFRKKYSINGTMILYLGRIHKSKGIDIAIKAFSKLTKEINNVVLVIAGSDDGYKTELERLIKKLNLSDKVMFTGFVDENDKMSAYVDADLFVHTVRYMGGVGLTPLEAILCNTPVIVTDECGEVVKEANCGYLVEYGDIEGLKEKMKWVIVNLEEGEEMVERGKKYIEENLTWEKVVERVGEVYEDCIHHV